MVTDRFGSNGPKLTDESDVDYRINELEDKVFNLEREQERLEKELEDLKIEVALK